MTKPVTRKLAVDCLLWRILPLGALPCTICGEPLKPGDDIQFDHVQAIVHTGPHIYQNLRPVHAVCHKAKTAQDIKDNAKVKRLANPKPSRHPMKSSGRKIPSRPFPKRRAA